MSLQGRATMTVETNRLEPPTSSRQPSPPSAPRVRLADLWSLTVIALALALTLAWTGLLVSLLWRGHRAVYLERFPNERVID